jgi:hypothetical protein
MNARVSSKSRYGSINAFSGHEYVKYEWRAVPEGQEDSARKNPYLEVQETVDAVVEKPVKPMADTKPEEADDKSARRAFSRKAKEE